ncbi:MAG: DUF971 domain-containing protein [Ignavibacteriales bacterium]|nr:DUF971 domain-containing protein [Ignavibacteriales bacterium]
MTATQIKLDKLDELSVKWSDGHDSRITLRTLRDSCPCASCQGETVLLRTYEPLPSPELPGKYNLKQVQQVGHYAIQLFWADGHATGIYTWERLRSLCECPICSEKPHTGAT